MRPRGQAKVEERVIGMRGSCRRMRTGRRVQLPDHISRRASDLSSHGTRRETDHFREPSINRPPLRTPGSIQLDPGEGGYTIVRKRDHRGIAQWTRSTGNVPRKDQLGGMETLRTPDGRRGPQEPQSSSGSADPSGLDDQSVGSSPACPSKSGSRSSNLVASPSASRQASRTRRSST